MALKEQITSEMKAALLSGDRFVGDTLRNLKAAILNEEVAAGARETGLSDEAIEKVIAKEVKKRHESAKLYRENNRDDLAEPEENEAKVLEKFLPQQLTEDELRDCVSRKIKEMSATDAKMMGQVIGAVKAEVGNRADGAQIAQLVKEQLQ